MKRASITLAVAVCLVLPIGAQPSPSDELRDSTAMVTAWNLEGFGPIAEWDSAC